ncbi:MAG: hypothetical protein IJF72_04755 [Clostridia bacterium]|nr:hypothetical protein [Clostridia bacterium]
MLLLGTSQQKLDDKNRIRLPAKFREQMGDKYILTQFAGGCIAVYSLAEGSKLIDQIVSVESFDPVKADIIREFTETAAMVDGDSQGRFMLTDDLIKFAKIQKDIVIVGSISKAEIWSLEVWEERHQKVNRTAVGFDETLKKLNELLS